MNMHNVNAEIEMPTFITNLLCYLYIIVSKWEIFLSEQATRTHQLGKSRLFCKTKSKPKYNGVQYDITHLNTVLPINKKPTFEKKNNVWLKK